MGTSEKLLNVVEKIQLKFKIYTPRPAERGVYYLIKIFC